MLYFFCRKPHQASWRRPSGAQTPRDTSPPVHFVKAAHHTAIGTLPAERHPRTPAPRTRRFLEKHRPQCGSIRQAACGNRQGVRYRCPSFCSRAPRTRNRVRQDGLCAAIAHRPPSNRSRSRRDDRAPDLLAFNTRSATGRTHWYSPSSKPRSIHQPSVESPPVRRSSTACNRMPKRSDSPGERRRSPTRGSGVDATPIAAIV